ncbi:hypothetical protein DFH09DRAFT_1316065 [Mycena vulgaris]|nr:hypothetical protein DFH09DRAFT_1316065 [Mycena vulgaris]
MLLPAITLRPRKTPIPGLGGIRGVSVYHPRVLQGFPIVQFSALSSKPDSGVVGVPLGVVLDACFILAGNQQGQLLLVASPHHRVADSDLDGLLQPGAYQFVVTQEGGELDYDYHLCASFSDWVPPLTIPDRWKGDDATDDVQTPFAELTDVSQAVKAADSVRCIITGAETGLQASHLVPRSEHLWFKTHYLVWNSYDGLPITDLNSVYNQVALRADLSSEGLDRGHFLFAPYAHGVAAVFVQHTARDLAHEYHLTEVNFPTRIRRCYLFARFAWNIFNFSTPGLVDAAAVVNPPKAHSDAVSLKRKPSNDAGGDPKKSKWSDGDGSLPIENVANVPRSREAEDTLLAIYEAIDAGFETSRFTVDDVQAGRYPGYSKIKRLELEYRRAHPEVSAVGNPRVWEPDDDDGYSTP